MSGGSIRRQMIKIISDNNFSTRTTELLHCTIDTIDSSFFQFLYDASSEAGLTNSELLYRSAAIIFEHTAVHLCDDLSDDECEYLEFPQKDGPVLVMLLQNLFLYTLEFSNISKKSIIRASALLNKTGNGQLEELHRDVWNTHESLSCAQLLNGFQLEAYFTILWDSTKLAQYISETFWHLGTILHLAVDINQNDSRIYSLSTKERKQLRNEALGMIRHFNHENILCIRKALSFAEEKISGL